MKVRVFYEGISFRIKNWKKIRELIVKVISEEGKFSGDLNFILADDEFVLAINRRFLKHNWSTDVISFNYGAESIPGGEIYISYDTVKNNALNYKVSCEKEILRVIIHGVLHLCGYDDSSTYEKEIMRRREDYWIERSEEGENGF